MVGLRYYDYRALATYTLRTVSIVSGMHRIPALALANRAFQRQPGVNPNFQGVLDAGYDTLPHQDLTHFSDDKVFQTNA